MCVDRPLGPRKGVKGLTAGFFQTIVLSAEVISSDISSLMLLWEWIGVNIAVQYPSRPVPIKGL